jgi:adenosine deaminase/aminodeoxyfutalosine deaminase
MESSEGAGPLTIPPALPVTELHLHLEGSIEPETLCQIDPGVTLEEVRERYQFTDFAGFLNAYKWVVRKLNQPADYALAARALRERLAAQGVTHFELNLSVGVMVFRQLETRAILDAIRAELPGVPLIFDAVRQFTPEAAVEVAELAVEYGAAFGIGGDESAQPMSVFRDAIRRANGLFIPHAGETTDARNVWEAVEHGAQRIGHGIRAIEDPALCRYLRDHQIPLEISITSNVATGSVPSVGAHPVRHLQDLGVPIILNTDDPAIFQTSLADEHRIARHVLGFTEPELSVLMANAYQYFRGIKAEKSSWPLSD